MVEAVNQESSIKAHDTETALSYVDVALQVSLNFDPEQRTRVADHMKRIAEVLMDDTEFARIREEVKE